MLGFHVVARLAARYGIAVHVAPTPGGGVTALVRLPDEMVSVRGTAEQGTLVGAVATPAGRTWDTGRTPAVHVEPPPAPAFATRAAPPFVPRLADDPYTANRPCGPRSDPCAGCASRRPAATGPRAGDHGRRARPAQTGQPPRPGAPPARARRPGPGGGSGPGPRAPGSARPATGQRRRRPPAVPVAHAGRPPVPGTAPRRRRAGRGPPRRPRSRARPVDAVAVPVRPASRPRRVHASG